MLYAGSDDGVYRIEGVQESGDTTAEKVLDAGRVHRVRQFESVDGLFATTESGLYHSPAGDEWQRLPVPADSIYAVTASPAGDRLYAGTRPAMLFTAALDDGLPTASGDWTAVEGFRALRDRHDWGIDRHEDQAQIRSLETHPDAPERIVAGVEVGGVYVSDDRGETWADRRIDEPDAPHSADVHHVTLGDGRTLIASTGTGLYRSTDVGRTWERLDAGHPQRYFREAFVHDGRVYAGASTTLGSTSWESEPNPGLFEGDSGYFRRLDHPRPEEVPLGWCEVDGDLLLATHRGTLLRRNADGWEQVGTVPTPGGVGGRYLQLTWHEPGRETADG